MAPRSRAGHHGGRGPATTTGDAALHAANNVLKKKNEYEKGYKAVHASTLLLAERLTAGGDIESALLSVAGDDEAKTEGAGQWLEEQRSRLKSLAEGNVTGMRDVEAFLAAVGSVKDDIVRNRREQSERRLEEDDDEDGGDSKPSTEDDPPPPDYERAVLDQIASHRAQAAASLPPLTDESMVREMRSRLGEKDAKKKKRGQDEDLEIVDDGPGAARETEAALKCPITGAMFVEPVKNKVCGHVYSREGFEHLFRGGRRGGHVRCPVAGCTNATMQRDQVEEDMEMGMRAHRYRKRMEQERRARDEDEDLVDEDEDGADGGGGGGTTVID